MKAIIEIGGKQYTVEEDSTIYIEKIKNTLGDHILFKDIKMINGVYKQDKLKDAAIEGIVEKHSKEKKIKVFTYKAKKNTKRRLGHRQPFTQVKIIKIPNID